MSQTPVQYGSAAALGSTLLVFGVIVVAMQKVLLRDRKRFVTHGGKAFRSPGRPSKLAAVALCGYTFIATVLPVSALVVVSLSNFWSAKIDVGKFTLDNFRQIFDESSVTDAVYNSVKFSLIAMLICLPVGFIAASVIVNGKRFGPLRAAADFLVAIPLGVPAVLFGAGFLLTYTEGPFVLYGTPWVVDPGVRHADAAVRHPHAGLRPDLARRGLRRGRPSQRLERDRRQPQGRPAADAGRAWAVLRR